MTAESVVVAGTLLVAFVLFFPALVNQFRPGHWLPRWVPHSLRRRPASPVLRAIAVVWTGLWSIGGQLVVAYLAALESGRGHVFLTAILALELLATGVIAAAVIRRSSRESTGRDYGGP